MLDFVVYYIDMTHVVSHVSRYNHANDSLSEDFLFVLGEGLHEVAFLCEEDFE